MNKQTFKVGDLVYFPQVSNKIFKLEDPGIAEYYPLVIANDPYSMCFTSEGKMSFEHERQTIFHVTEENCELLSKLYGIEFEKPKPRPTSKQVIEHLLKTHKYVPCYTSDVNETPSSGSVINFITRIYDRSSLPFVDAEEGTWQFAIPFDIKTGEVITEIEE